MTRLLTSVGALALSAIAFAFAAHAVPKGGNLQLCLNRCYDNPGRNGSVAQCTATCRVTAGNNARATAARRNPTPPTINNGGNGTGHRH